MEAFATERGELTGAGALTIGDMGTDESGDLPAVPGDSSAINSPSNLLTGVFFLSIRLGGLGRGEGEPQLASVDDGVAAEALAAAALNTLRICAAGGLNCFRCRLDLSIFLDDFGDFNMAGRGGGGTSVGAS